MKLTFFSVVGLLTNLRWDWLNFIFFIKLMRGRVRSKIVFYDKGGPVPTKKDDIIYEQPHFTMHHNSVERSIVPCISMLFSIVEQSAVYLILLYIILQHSSAHFKVSL